MAANPFLFDAKLLLPSQQNVAALIFDVITPVLGVHSLDESGQVVNQDLAQLVALFSSGFGRIPASVVAGQFLKVPD